MNNDNIINNSNLGLVVDCLWAIIPRAILVKIHERDEQAIAWALYAADHQEFQFPLHPFHVPPPMRLQIDRKALLDTVDYIFARIAGG